MVLKVGVLARLAEAGRHKPIQQWVTAHHGPVTAVASVALGSLAALISLTAFHRWTARGTASGWVFLENALLEGWLVGVIAFTALLPDRAPDQRRAAIARWLLWSTLLVLCLYEIEWHRRLRQRWGPWDAQSISAWLVVLIGLTLVASTPERLHQALQRLRDRDVLPESVEAGAGMEHELDRIAHRWSILGGWCVAVALPATKGLLSDLAHGPSWLIGPGGANLIFFVVTGAAVGGWAGRMAGYGRLGHVLTKHGLELRVVPGHPDGAGGLRPIGAFYLYQSGMASLPAVYLIVWGLVFLLGGHYRDYLNYLWLLALAILAEVLVFVVPMLSVHASMREQRKAFLARADRLSRAIATTQARLDDTGLEERDAVKRQLTELIERYQTLEKTPTWPIDRSIRRHITLQNLALLLPLAGSLVRQDELLKQVQNLLNGWS
jgi:hypothetical protein